VSSEIPEESNVGEDIVTSSKVSIATIPVEVKKLPKEPLTVTKQVESAPTKSALGPSAFVDLTASNPSDSACEAGATKKSPFLRFLSPKGTPLDSDSDVLSMSGKVPSTSRFLYVEPTSSATVDEGESSLRLLKRDQRLPRGLAESNISDNDADQSGAEGDYSMTLLKSLDRLPGTRRHLSARSRNILKEYFEQNVPKNCCDSKVLNTH
jgi:hypothetical protein